MTAQLIDGQAIQQRLIDRTRQSLRDAGVVPEVALIMVEGDDPMAAINYRLHQRVFRDAGFAVRPIALPTGTDRDGLLGTVHPLNADEDLDAIMALMPLPEHLDIRDVLAAIDPDKEAEGLHLAHAVRLNPLSTLPPTRLPVVPVAVLSVLAEAAFDPTGAHLVVLTDPELTETNPVAKMIARVGAFALLPPGAVGCAVPVTYPRAPDLSREADLLIVSLNKPGVVTSDWVKPGAVVIDFNALLQGFQPHPTDPRRSVPRLVGGIDLESVRRVARVVSPVPGGIGPVMLGVLVEQIAQMALDRAAARTTPATSGAAL
jgi:methylenetetrahydrofolate dehydrogenase (NADP+) / methenyltetrahydrofolate cyclohydrolase